MARLKPHLLWAALVLGLATVVAFGPALKGPFLFDDGPSIPDNASIRQLWPLSEALHPPAEAAVAGRPVVNYSLAVTYAFNAALGIDPRTGPDNTLGYHLFSLFCHLACGLLLFGVLTRTIARQQYSPRWA